MSDTIETLNQRASDLERLSLETLSALETGYSPLPNPPLPLTYTEMMRDELAQLESDPEPGIKAKMGRKDTRVQAQELEQLLSNPEPEIEAAIQNGMSRPQAEKEVNSYIEWLRAYIGLHDTPRQGRLTRPQAEEAVSKRIDYLRKELSPKRLRRR